MSYEEIKLECLRLANTPMASGTPFPAEDVVKRATAYSDFIFGQKPSPKRGKR